ncbi:phosphotransferase enzyme family protein [Nocardia xishanensis]|uniref:Phosphotransferase enzyme family protein n=1 Tax=Nocardia xishanensis TaxID=238964 RepID=A0ABW7WW85_9NOCA
MTPTSSSDTLLDNNLQHILHEACGEAGFDPHGASLVKYTNNAVFRLARAPIVVRIAGPATAVRVPKVVAVARWLAAHDMPSVRLIDEVPQPISVIGRPVTFWHAVPVSSSAPAPDGAALGEALRLFHALPAPTFVLPHWDPLNSIRQRIGAQRVLTDSDHELLVDRVDHLADELAALDFVLPQGPIHGDAFVGNLIAGPAGAVICDFDSTSIGPREWDFTPAAVGQLRFRYDPDHHRRLADSIGYDVTKWPGFETLRELRELQLVTSVLPTLGENPSLRPQWEDRFRSYMCRDLTARWTPYS